MHKNLQLLSARGAGKLLGVSTQRLHYLVKHYKIPHHKVDSGRIFEKADLISFQKARSNKMKYTRKK